MTGSEEWSREVEGIEAMFAPQVGNFFQDGAKARANPRCTRRPSRPGIWKLVVYRSDMKYPARTWKIARTRGQAVLVRKRLPKLIFKRFAHELLKAQSPARPSDRPAHPRAETKMRVSGVDESVDPNRQSGDARLAHRDA